MEAVAGVELWEKFLLVLEPIWLFVGNMRTAHKVGDSLGTRGEVPSAPASVKALRPLRGAQNRAALTDASAPGEALL